MNIRRVLMRIIPAVIFGSLAICIVFYLIQYSSLAAEYQINFKKQWFWIAIMAVLLLDAISIIKNAYSKEADFGKIQYTTNVLSQVMTGILLLFVSFALVDSFISIYMNTNFAELPVAIVFSILFLEIAFKLAVGTGIGEKGIAAKGKYYRWDELECSKLEQGYINVVLPRREGKLTLKVQDKHFKSVEELMKQQAKKTK